MDTIDDAFLQGILCLFRKCFCKWKKHKQLQMLV